MLEIGCPSPQPRNFSCTADVNPILSNQAELPLIAEDNVSAHSGVIGLGNQTETVLDIRQGFHNVQVQRLLLRPTEGRHESSTPCPPISQLPSHLPPTKAISPAVAVVAASAASAPDLAASIMPFTPDALANGFTTLIGALTGAMLAYIFQRLFLKNQEHRAALMSAHRMMFALLQQINTIVLIQRDYVHSHLDNPGRFISIPATSRYDTGKNVLQMTDLSFLLDSSKGRAVLYELYIAQENYVEALNQWNLRSSLHVQQVQPALASLRIPSGATITEEDLKKGLGPLLYGSIVNTTDNSLELLRRAFEKLTAIKKKGRAYVVERFKTDDFTDFDFPDTYGLTGSEPSPQPPI